MVLYAFYIFDRHTECVYSRRWAPPRLPASSAGNKTARPQSGSSITSNGEPAPRRGMTHSDDEKLIFGLVFSLRNMTKKLGGDENIFLSYRTGEYKLHYYETPTRMKFVMLTDTKQVNMRPYLHQIWANLWVEYVIKNPLAPIEHPGGVGVANDMFEKGLETFISAVLPA